MRTWSGRWNVRTRDRRANDLERIRGLPARCRLLVRVRAIET